MTDKSQKFEQKIHRIHELLENSGANVTLNEHIPDPDNPSQKRQIDVTIRNEDHLTLIECRIHQTPQDVTWIEELIGRKVSLNAQAIIAVSASGFTKGAIRKADRHGILLRDLKELSDEEILTWSKSLKLSLYYYTYEEFIITIFFQKTVIIDQIKASDELKSHPCLRSIFSAAAQVLDSLNLFEKNIINRTAKFSFNMSIENLKIQGEIIGNIKIEGKAKLIEEEKLSPGVLAYDDPRKEVADRKIFVQKYLMGDTEIIYENGRVSVVLDLSKLVIPPLSQFRFIHIEGKQENEFESFSTIGIDRVLMPIGIVQVRLVS